ncbi:glycosyltransferase family 2 protein [Candidatus Borrarchaeum sp.]|uniref:glycosyltransferase family 2 protein n=1 Tax=Candidatus Borrarchaeum sp. TaxID=2846742 RepID=UPI00257E8675|nr:glycosyltransferase family 2 protein [Candidatus Borrarchaeum sp.]
MYKIQNVSIVIPAHNEENNLRLNIKTIHEYLAKLLGCNFEIILVENGSTDRTAVIAKELETEYPNLKAFFLPTPSYGEAYRYGILRANYDMVTVHPVDLAFSLNFIERAYRLLNKFTVILGVRYHQKSKVSRPSIRNLISRVHTKFVNTLFDMHYNDVNCLKAFRTPVGKKLVKLTTAKGPFIEVELVCLLNAKSLKFYEIPLNHIEEEIARHPLYIVRSILKNFIELFKLKFHK